MTKELRAYMAKIGSKGGSSVSGKVAIERAKKASRARWGKKKRSTRKKILADA